MVGRAAKWEREVEVAFAEQGGEVEVALACAGAGVQEDEERSIRGMCIQPGELTGTYILGDSFWGLPKPHCISW